MNKLRKILLSAMIVYLGALVIPLKVHSENLENEPVTVQAAIKSIGINIAKFIENSASINFEVDAIIKEMNLKMEKIESIEDKKKWFIAYKNIIDEYSYIIDPPESVYDYFDDEELDLLFHVVQAEAGDEYSFDEKVNVACVVFNRLEHEKFPDRIVDVLIEKNQFSPILDGRYKEVEVSEETILACEYAFQIEDTTGGALFFDSNNKLKYQFMFNDGAHRFYCLKDNTN